MCHLVLNGTGSLKNSFNMIFRWGLRSHFCSVIDSFLCVHEILLAIYLVSPHYYKYVRTYEFYFFFCDLQIVLWVTISFLLKKESITLVVTVFLIMFLFQYLPKIYHSVCLLRRMQDLSGYISGTVWWGIALNLIAYFVASHVSHIYILVSFHAMFISI